MNSKVRNSDLKVSNSKKINSEEIEDNFIEKDKQNNKDKESKKDIKKEKEDIDNQEYLEEKDINIKSNSSMDSGNISQDIIKQEKIPNGLFSFKDIIIGLIVIVSLIGLFWGVREQYKNYRIKNIIDLNKPLLSIIKNIYKSITLYNKDIDTVVDDNHIVVKSNNNNLWSNELLLFINSVPFFNGKNNQISQSFNLKQKNQMIHSFHFNQEDFLKIKEDVYLVKYNDDRLAFFKKLDIQTKYHQKYIDIMEKICDLITELGPQNIVFNDRNNMNHDIKINKTDSDISMNDIQCTLGGNKKNYFSLNSKKLMIKLGLCTQRDFYKQYDNYYCIKYNDSILNFFKEIEKQLTDLK
jgi:hypothetical protein